ncbi:MAG: hypothetical protein ACFUZC_03405 [Chthoniobacteraceae bacterium]
MKLNATIVALSLASSAAFADDVEGTGAPVTPITPVTTGTVSTVKTIQTVWTVKPVIIELISVLTSPTPDPAAVRAYVDQLTPTDISKIIVTLAGNPSALGALVNALSTNQAAEVSVQLLNNPEAIKAVIAQLSTARITEIRVALFIADIDAWSKFSTFLDCGTPVPNARAFGKTGLDAARDELRRRIEKEGYSPEVLEQAEALMQRASQPASAPDLKQLKPLTR